MCAKGETDIQGWCLNSFQFILGQNGFVHGSCLLNISFWQEEQIHSRTSRHPDQTCEISISARLFLPPYKTRYVPETTKKSQFLVVAPECHWCTDTALHTTPNRAHGQVSSPAFRSLQYRKIQKYCITQQLFILTIL